VVHHFVIEGACGEQVNRRILPDIYHRQLKVRLINAAKPVHERLLRTHQHGRSIERLPDLWAIVIVHPTSQSLSAANCATGMQPRSKENQAVPEPLMIAFIVSYESVDGFS
jgi:hypothetical protein